MLCRSLQTAMAIALAIAGVAHSQEPPLPDGQRFLADTLKSIRSNDLVRSRYVFQEKETRHSYDAAGRATKTQVRVYEVHPSADPELTYRRLVSVNGVEPPDLAKRDAAHQKQVQEWTARRQREGEDARAARRRRDAEEEQSEQAVVEELRSIYDIRMTGRETIDGRSAIVFTFDPRPGYAPRTPQGRIINHFRGRAWIDEQDRELVRMMVDVVETVSVRLGFIVRLVKGSRGRMERRKIDGEAWLPTYTRFTGTGRVFFVWRMDLDQETEFSAYRKRDSGGLSPLL